MPPRAAEKHAGRAAPIGANFSCKRKVPKGFNLVRAKLLFGWADSRFGKPRSSLWEGFNFVSAKPPLRRAESRFAEPRFLLLGKDLIGFVRSRHCSELNRGLQNLDSPCKGTILFFSLVRKEPKVPQRVATLWTPGDDSNLRSIRSFILNDRRSSCNRPCREPQASRVSPVGFESVRKGSRTANARLRSFEKGMFYCKLTVSFRG